MSVTGALHDVTSQSIMRKVRAILARVESLPAMSFILVVAAIAGVLRSVPGYLVRDNRGGALFTVIITYTAAMLLWWVAVRRRQFSVWRLAWHLVVALALADMLGFAVSMAMFSIDTRGDAAQHLMQTPLTTFLGAFVPPILVFGLVRFIGAALLLGLGRRLPGSGRLLDRATPATTHREAVI
jgi:hypothetical protein